MTANRLFFCFAILVFLSLSACSSQSSTNSQVSSVSPLNPNDTNFIFVVSPDLNNSTTGDVALDTGNLTPQGLNRSLMLASYLQQNVLGNQNVTSIYALQPVSQLQTANSYPNMAGIEFIQQFALLNQYSLPISATESYTANSYPIKTSYANGIFPSSVSPSVNTTFCQSCQGLSLNDINGSNSMLISNIQASKNAGFYVFTAPWETILGLMSIVNTKYDANLTLPTSFNGSNSVYVISATPNKANSTKLTTYTSSISPKQTYPTLPTQISTTNPCQAAPFNISASLPINSKINKNQTVYFIRHAEAHPVGAYDDGNYVAAGQWRALSLPNALSNKINPSMVVSVDPAQLISSANEYFSYIRPSLTAQPYAIANNLPFVLASSINWGSVSDAVQYFFFNKAYENKTILVAWEHRHIEEIINLFSSTSYYSKTTNTNQNQAVWESADYDSIWSVTLDSSGNLSMNNSMCEGINSSLLPITAPQF